MATIPDFSLPGSDGTTYTRGLLSGQRYVLYFYPRDDTPGCTREACDFRDQLTTLNRLKVRVFGVSPDSLERHERFIAKHHLNFVLLTDSEHELSSALKVWTKKSLYGRTFMGIERSTFLIGAEGAILRSWRKVKVTGHAMEVLEAAREG